MLSKREENILQKPQLNEKLKTKKKVPQGENSPPPPPFSPKDTNNDEDKIDHCAFMAVSNSSIQYCSLALRM